MRSERSDRSRSDWRPVYWAGIVAVTVGGFALAALLALLALYAAFPDFWGGTPRPFGARGTSVSFVALAGVAAAAGPALAGALRRSLAGFIVAGILVGLGVTTAVVVGIATA